MRLDSRISEGMIVSSPHSGYESFRDLRYL